MKLLFVVHYFLPRHQAGTEIYTASLARAFKNRGHEVMIFTTEDGTPAGGRFEPIADEWEGIPVHRLLTSGPADFERTYLDPELDELFAGFLAERRPDIIHFQHAFRLSTGMIEKAQTSGAGVMVTLADYWFICPPLLLLQPGFQLCPGPEPDRCANCGNAIGTLYAGGPAGSMLHTLRDRLVRAAHAVKRKLPRGLVDRLRAWRQKKALADPDSGLQRRKRMILDRQAAMKRALAAADLVIAPSGFMRQKMIAAGAVDPEKIVHSDYGFEEKSFSGRERKPSGHLRFGFIGTPVEHKGAHVAVAAMNRLMDTEAELIIYGDLSWFPAYARRLRRLAKNPRVAFKGRFEHDEVADILAGLDALIVPSLWFENSPLTIHEAFLAGVPVIVSDIGGMAELIREGGGQAFRTGEAEDLARVMRGLIENPDRLRETAKSIPRVKTIEENAEELMAHYARFSRPKKSE